MVQIRTGMHQPYRDVVGACMKRDVAVESKLYARHITEMSLIRVSQSGIIDWMKSRDDAIETSTFYPGMLVIRRFNRPSAGFYFYWPVEWGVEVIETPDSSRLRELVNAEVKLVERMLWVAVR